MDFVALDFETANNNRASACSLGMVKVTGGQVVDSYATLIKPAESHNWENFWNFNVHGIPFDAYQTAPALPDVWQEIQSFIGTAKVFAHNAPFDKSVLNRTLESWGLGESDFKFHCSMSMAQSVLQSKADVSLPALAAKFGIEGLKHHDALSDAETCAEIVLALATLDPGFQIDSLSAPVKRVRVQVKLEGDKSFKERAEKFLENPDNGIVGKVFTLTGTISIGKRSEIMGIIEGLGGGIAKKTSRKTNVLVQGVENPNSFAPGHEHSASYEMAEAFRAEGLEIETIFEDQFVELIPGEFFESK